MTQPAESARHLGLWGATGVGVGAIVGGGILALAGVAFRAAGPSAIVAFALNGAIAALTAISFGRLARAFPESGGSYAYAKKVMSIEVAFTVGWVVWFASIVAAVLYALGFAAFAVEFARWGLSRWVAVPGWLVGRGFRVFLALAATGAYSGSLILRPRGGGQWATVGKVVVFAVLIAAGGVCLLRAPVGTAAAQLTPFFSGGGGGLLQAMGYSFIALQGFDLIAAVGGEVRDPRRNLPRSMYLSLGIALAIYLPLLFLITTVGVDPGTAVGDAAARNPEGLIAAAGERFLGPAGYLLVIVAGLLSMLSALQANLLGASRVAFAMARDRTLPRRLGRIRGDGGAPAWALAATAAAVGAVVLAIGDVDAAGAASSLIFLVSFAMAHWAAILARRRSGDRRFPVVAVAGAATCLGLGVFQGFAVPAAGALGAVWLAAGMGLYLTLFASGARVADAGAEARDPELARLRGHNPLTLLPVANPASAASLVGVADALVPPGVGRVLVLSVVARPAAWQPEEFSPALRDAQAVLGESLHASFAGHLSPETLITISSDPWEEIVRVARIHRCESLVLGLTRLEAPGVERRVEELIGRVPADVVVARTPVRWQLTDARRVLVPIGGRPDQSYLRARLFASLSRRNDTLLTFLRVVAPGTSDETRRRLEREMRALAGDEASGPYELEVVSSDDPGGEVVARAVDHDVVVMGMQRRSRSQKVFGEIPMRIARETEVPLILISRRG
ncbi:MAG TPA: amino acid permease [Deferrisomatales bacterium]|nr:amino acid permease [Deferrisomatales bacterium]